MVICYWLLVLDNNCNPIWYGYDAHVLVVVQIYNYIHQGVYHHVVNLPYKYMNYMIHMCLYCNPLAFLPCCGIYYKFSTLPFVPMHYNICIWIVPSFWSSKPTYSRLNIQSQGTYKFKFLIPDSFLFLNLRKALRILSFIDMM